MKARKIKQLYHKALDSIYGKDEVTSFFYLISNYYSKASRVKLALEPDFMLTETEVACFLKALEHLKQQKPIQYILGQTEFYGLSFRVNKNVLIPRPETEELVALLIKDLKKAHMTSGTVKILDIGTGSGCIAISLAKHLPNALVYALDVSKAALKLAKQNAEDNVVNINFIETDILDESTWSSVVKDLEFDIIVSNPPYVRECEKTAIKPNVLDFEPHLALFVKDENPLVFYKAIARFASHNLKSNGRLYFEINQYLGDDTKEILEEASFKFVNLIKDLNDNDRILMASHSL